MGTILQPEDLTVFGADEATAAKIIEVLEQRAFMVAPCLRGTTDEDVLKSAASILIPAALRWASNPLQVEGSEGAGPFSKSLKPVGRLILTNEEDALKALCSNGVARPAAGLPVGNFPDSPDYTHLFATPRHQSRRWW